LSGAKLQEQRPILKRKNFLISSGFAGCPESVRSRFPPLLQSGSFQPFSVLMTGAVRRRSSAVFRTDLDGAKLEPEWFSLSEGHILSEAWGSGDLTPKL
jgi:hypothetical protein